MVEAASADETLSRARAICSKVVDDTQRAIMLREMHARAGYEADVADAFGDSRASWGFNCVVAAIYFELVMVLNRIHDRSDDTDTASLPALMKLISQNEFQSALLQEKARQLNKISEVASAGPHVSESNARLARRRIEERYRSALTSLKQAQASWETLGGSALCSGLREIRRKVLAHSALDLTEMKGARKARFGDADQLLDDTMPLVKQVSVALTGHEPDFGDDVAGWRTKADDFWRHAAHLSKDGPGGRRSHGAKMSKASEERRSDG